MTPDEALGYEYYGIAEPVLDALKAEVLRLRTENERMQSMAVTVGDDLTVHPDSLWGRTLAELEQAREQIKLLRAEVEPIREKYKYGFNNSHVSVYGTEADIKQTAEWYAELMRYRGMYRCTLSESDESTVHFECPSCGSRLHLATPVVVHLSKV